MLKKNLVWKKFFQQISKFFWNFVNGIHKILIVNLSAHDSEKTTDTLETYNLHVFTFCMFFFQNNCQKIEFICVLVSDIYSWRWQVCNNSNSKWEGFLEVFRLFRTDQTSPNDNFWRGLILGFRNFYDTTMSFALKPSTKVLYLEF